MLSTRENQILCKIETSGRRMNRQCASEEQIAEIFKWLQENERTFFAVGRSSADWIDVILTERGCLVIHKHDGDYYLAEDASTTPLHVQEVANLRIEGQLTPIAKNLMLTRRMAFDIAREYASSGKLSGLVYWLAEGPAA